MQQDDPALVFELSERLGMDEVEALVLLKRYQRDERGHSHAVGRNKNEVEGNGTGGKGYSGIIPRRLATSTLALTRSTRGTSSNSTTTTPDETTLTQLTRYYQAETLALTRLLTTIIVRAAGASNHDPMELAIQTNPHADPDDPDARLPIGEKGMRLDFMCERALFQLAKHHTSTGAGLIQIIFSSFARAAHKTVTYKPIGGGGGGGGGGSTHGSAGMSKSWVLHHLQTQTGLLESLFQLVYWLPSAASGSEGNSDVPLLSAETAVGLIQGIFGSTFGAQQANARLIESLDIKEAGRWLDKIEALLGLIALETLGLSGISRGLVVPADEYPAETEDEDKKTLVQSKQAVDIIHTTLGTATLETTRRSPFPLVLLAWSFILSRLNPEILPAGPSEGEFVPVYQTVASIALGEEMQVFDKWTGLLQGKGFWKDDRGDVGDDYVTGYKDTMNCESGLAAVLPKGRGEDGG